MRLRALGSGCLALVLAGPALPADGQTQGSHTAGAEIEPFSSHYVAAWRDISVGVSDLELRSGTLGPDTTVYKWTISA